MITVNLLPPNPDLFDHSIVLKGHRRKHIEVFIEKYFSNWDWVQENKTKYRRTIQLNTRGKPTLPIVTVHGGVADYNSDEVAVIDYDTYEG